MFDSEWEVESFVVLLVSVVLVVSLLLQAVKNKAAAINTIRLRIMNMFSGKGNFSSKHKKRKGVDCAET